MKRFNIPATVVCSVCVALLFGGLTFVGCTEVDDTLGAGFAPNTQEMRLGTRTIARGFRTSLYRTDSIRTSNIGVGLMGATRSDTFGLRTAGFYTQFTWNYCPDEEEGFGYRPIFDSIQLGISVTASGGDTTVVNTFDVFEVIDDTFLTEQSDTLFYGTFDPEPYLAAEPLFSFEFPDQERGLYTTSETVTMQPTESGRAFVDRLMLQSGPYAGGDLTGYTDPDDFTGNFKGLYIRPRPLAGGETGGIYQIDLTASGMALFCRNRDKTDPTLICDTLTSLYYFCDNASKGGKASINRLTHDYAGSLLEGLDFDEKPVTEEDPEPRYAECATCYVEGMGGVVTRIVLTEAFFEELDAILTEENAADGMTGEDAFAWQSLLINRAALSVYDEAGRYDWTQVVPDEAMIDRMDTFLPRLGLYTSLKSVSPVPDYNYVYEASGVTLAYGGYFNRSQGCYTMDIAMHVQALWNNYRSEGELPSEAARTLYLAPDAYSFNTFRVMSGQGAGGTNPAPLKMELTYTLIK